jgi:glycine dehydrogenase subunit 2
MIDEGYHPMTMYFPLVVHGAMLIEPTESESKASLDALHRKLAAFGHPGQKGRPGGVLPRGPAPYATPALGRNPRGASADPALEAAFPHRPSGGVTPSRPPC